MSAIRCALCEATVTRVIRTKLRGGIQRNVFRCDDCGLVFLESQDQELKEYYREEYRRTHTPAVGKQASPEEIFQIYLPMQEMRIAKIRSILRLDMKVLDIGCSAGHFLKALAPHVEECMGIEYNANDVAFIRNTLGYKVWSSPIEETDIPEGSLDLITVFQTFEHIEHPVRFLHTVKKYLKPDGYLVIEVPNIEDPLLSLYGVEAYADFYFRDAHLFYYSTVTLRRMVEKCGYMGEISTVQRYNMLNHLWWIFTGSPQPDASVAMGEARLHLLPTTDATLEKNIQVWIRKADQEYRDLVNAAYKGESVFFVGRKKE